MSHSTSDCICLNVVQQGGGPTELFLGVNYRRHCHSTEPGHREGDALIMCGHISVEHDVQFS